MSKSIPNATEWVAELPRGARIHWAELESHVFREHPAVLRLLGPAAGEVRSQGRAFSIVFGVLIAIACLVGLGVVWAPIWGLATLAGDAWGVVDVDGAMAIPVAGLAMLVSCIVLGAMLVRRMLSNGVSGTDDSSIADGTIVLGTLTAVGMILVGFRQQPAGWELWLVPTVLAILLAIIVTILSRRSRETAGSFSRATVTNPQRAADWREQMRAAIAQLPEAERQRLALDQQGAIEKLRRQGTISPDDSHRALAAELGFLSVSLAAHDPR